MNIEIADYSALFILPNLEEDAVLKIQRIAGETLGFDVSVGPRHLEFDYSGRDTGRKVVTFLCRVAPLIGNAEGEMVKNEGVNALAGRHSEVPLVQGTEDTYSRNTNLLSPGQVVFLNTFSEGVHTLVFLHPYVRLKKRRSCFTRAVFFRIRHLLPVLALLA